MSQILNEFDPKSLLETLGNDPELFDEVLEIFIKGYKAKMQLLSKALKEGQTKDLIAHAHNLKGDLVTLGYVPAVQFAQKLEDLGHTGKVAGGLELFQGLEKALVPILNFYSKRKG